MADQLNSNGGVIVNRPSPTDYESKNGIRPEPANTNTQKDGMSVSSQVTVGPIKKVDTGSSDNLKDVTAASLAVSAGKGPRAGMVQESLNSKLKANAPGTVNNYPSDQGAFNS